jgi:hypothetical protein
MSVFIMSASFGVGAALIFGGYVVQAAAVMGPVTLPVLGTLRSWQLVLLIVGGATLAMLIPLGSIVDPKRKQAGSTYVPGSLPQTFAYVWGNRSAFTPVMLGITLLNLFEHAAAVWVPSYLIRTLHLSASYVGYLVGAFSMVFGVGSVVAAGAIADRLRARGHVNANLQVILFSLPVAWAGLLIFTQSRSLAWVMAGYALMWSGQLICGPLGPAALQSITLDGMRAKVTAIWLLLANLVGIGFGPTAVALLTDYYFGNPDKVGTSLLYVGTTMFAAAGIAIWIFSAAHTRLAIKCESPDVPLGARQEHFSGAATSGEVT